MKYKLKVYCIWEFGQRKDSQGQPHQEDSIFPAFGQQADRDRLFILCDGMGGHDAGEVASATVCEAMSQSVLGNGQDQEGVFTAEDFSNALASAFDALDKKDSGAEKKMGTTMTFLKLHSKGATIAHIGDSRVYHIRPGKTGDETEILFQTEDHSLVNDLIKIGELSREEARFSKQKNVITRAMQPNMARRPKADVYYTADIQRGDYFYLCSDGMLEQPEMENGESLKNIFSEQGGSDENKVEILKSVTERNRDNHTAFIVHIIEVENSSIEGAMKNDKVLPQIADDKFTAIVEVDEQKIDSQSENVSSEQTVEQTSLCLPTNLPKKDSKNPLKSNADNSVSNSIVIKEVISLTKALFRKLLNNDIIRFIVAAIIVLTVIIGLNCFGSCSKKMNNGGKEETEIISGKPSFPNGLRNASPNKNSTVNLSTSPANASTLTAIDVVNSPASSDFPIDELNTTLTSFEVLLNNIGEEIVNSDEQTIINHISKKIKE